LIVGVGIAIGIDLDGDGLYLEVENWNSAQGREDAKAQGKESHEHQMLSESRADKVHDGLRKNIE
jgi:hypothetical protein